MQPLRVLELGNYVVPAYAGMILAEQGHAVEKWTNGKDPILDCHRGGELWAWINHGKRVVMRHPRELPDALPTQQVLGIVEVVDCREMGPDLRGDPFASGPWCWILADPRPLAEPIDCRGWQGLWNIDLPADCLTRPTRPARPAARRLF